MRLTAEKSRRLIVRPLAALLVLHGLAMLLVVAFALVPLTWIPFLSYEAGRWAVAAIAILHMGVGLGLWHQSRVAWITLVTESILGIPLVTAAALIDPPGEDGLPLAFLAFGVTAGIITAVGIYAGTRPAFDRPA